MLIDELTPLEYLPFLLIKVIGLSETAAKALIGEYGEMKVQEHALRCLWLLERKRVHTPPAWLTAAYPDTLLVRQDGRRAAHGGRRHYCPSSDTYRRLAARITARLAPSNRSASRPPKNGDM